MGTFLEKISEEILELDDLSSLLVLLPNKRAAQTVKEHLIQKAKSAIWLPQFHTIEELVATYGRMDRAQPVELYVEFYKSQLEVLQKKAYDLTMCMEWAPAFLKDFNDIDLGLADPEEIYQHLYELKQVDQWSPERRESFEGEFLTLWKSVPSIYKVLNEGLKKKNRFYRGRMLRNFTENEASIVRLSRAGLKTIFAGGFNALTPAEELILKKIGQSFDLRKYWQLQSFHQQNSIQEAGTYLSKIYKAEKETFHWIFDDIYSKDYFITSIETSGTSEMLDACVHRVAVDLTDSESTISTIVLPDESLLLPLISRLNFPFTSSVGIPFSELPIAKFTVRIAEFMEGKSPSAAVLNTDFALKYTKEVSVLLAEIEENLADSLLKKWVRLIGFFSGLKADSTDYLAELSRNKMLELVRDLERIFQEGNSTFEVITPLLHALFMGAEIRIPDHENARVNILGILETRLQMYDRLHVLAVEEGVLPKSNTSMSFLPQFLRRTFGLSLESQSTSVQSYNFMNLIANSGTISLYHRAGSDGTGIKEKSRYVEQIHSEWGEVNPQVHFKQIAIPSKTLLVDPPSYSLGKIPEVEAKILNYLQNSGLSASAINNYRSSPLQFYLNNVLGIREQRSEGLLADESTFGSLVHEILEKEYTPWKGSLLSITILDEIEERIQSIEPADYPEHLSEDQYSHISLAAAKKYCLRWVLLEKRDLIENKAEIEIVALESFHLSTLQIGQFTIKLKGVIDRVDRRNGQLRILDYKTGTVPDKLYNKDAKGHEFFEDPKAVQLFFYDLLLNKNYANAQLGLVPLKSAIPKPMFIDAVVLSENREVFKGFIADLVVEILDNNTALVQPEDFKYKFVE